MQISLRSYLTAGVSLTAASAIAFTPLVIPTTEQAITIPNVSTSDVQLAVSPADIEAFVAALQETLDDINQAVADVIAIPGQTLADVLSTAAELNAQLFADLIAATPNATIAALLNIIGNGTTASLQSLATTVTQANDEIYATTLQVGNLLSSALTSSLERTLLAILNVANNPLDSSAYAELINSGIGAGQTFLTAGIGSVQSIGNAALNLAGIGLGGIGTQFAIALGSFSALLGELSTAADSEIVDAAIALVQGFVLAPISIIGGQAFVAAGAVLNAAGTAFNTALEGLSGIVNVLGSSLQAAIAQIGQNPLDPANYAVALSALVAGGFGAFNIGVDTVAGLAQVPLALATQLTNVFAGTITGLTSAFAGAISGVLTAVGLPANIAQIPLDIADSINEVVNTVRDGINGGIGLASDLVTGTRDVVLDLSNAFEDAIFSILPPPPPLMLTTNTGPELALYKSSGAGLNDEGNGEAGGDVGLGDDQSGDGTGGGTQGNGTEGSGDTQGNGTEGSGDTQGDGTEGGSDTQGDGSGGQGAGDNQGGDDNEGGEGVGDDNGDLGDDESGDDNNQGDDNQGDDNEGGGLSNGSANENNEGANDGGGQDGKDSPKGSDNEKDHDNNTNDE